MASRFLQSISVIKLSLTRIWCQYVPRESGPASWVPETWHIRSPTQGSLSAWAARAGVKLGEEVSSLLKVNGCCCKAEDSCWGWGCLEPGLPMLCDYVIVESRLQGWRQSLLFSKVASRHDSSQPCPDCCPVLCLGSLSKVNLKSLTFRVKSMGITRLEMESTSTICSVCDMGQIAQPTCALHSHRKWNSSWPQWVL